MAEFTISRIHTDHGIFRISGKWGINAAENASIDVTFIEMMGSDGWILLDNNHHTTVSLIDKLQQPIYRHLQVANGK